MVDSFADLVFLFVFCWRLFSKEWIGAIWERLRMICAGIMLAIAVSDLVLLLYHFCHHFCHPESLPSKKCDYNYTVRLQVQRRLQLWLPDSRRRRKEIRSAVGCTVNDENEFTATTKMMLAMMKMWWRRHGETKTGKQRCTTSPNLAVAYHENCVHLFPRIAGATTEKFAAESSSDKEDNQPGMEWNGVEWNGRKRFLRFSHLFAGGTPIHGPYYNNIQLFLVEMRLPVKVLISVRVGHVFHHRNEKE